MATVKAPGCRERLLNRAEHDRKHDIEGTVEPADRVGQGPRVLRDGGGYPGMGELQQQCTAGAEKYRCFLVDMPHHRAGSEGACSAVRRSVLDYRELTL
jgi:hypothetical protein